jgi:D-lactate dehydrogenase
MNIDLALQKIIPKERIRSRYIDRISFASDAGFYQLIPKAVVQPIGEEEIISLFKFSQTHSIPIVFRAGGTSLSGQSITDGILVDLSQHWNRITLEREGNEVRVQPGITGAMVNLHLKRSLRKIGPDPSSISAAMMGGILSNNASGMCCGVALNSYHTTKHVRFILPDGRTFSTERKEDYDRFQSECQGLYTELHSIRSSIFGNKELHARIRNKYRTKTTVGYSLNAFIDYEHPLDIFAHLLIGGEGTLAFISEAVLKTVPDHPHKSTSLLYFNDIYGACQAIVPLTKAGAMMVELMDRASLRAVENVTGMPAIVKTLPDTAAALLIEFQESSIEKLDERVNQFLSTSKLSLLNPPVFTKDPKEQDFLWKVRKGLFPAVGAVRASGTTVILEDVAFPVEKLGDAILDLQSLFKKYQYDNAIIFGHAKDGNIHFVVTQSFRTEAEVHRYNHFIQDVVALVVPRYDGTLKAEHGTGRNMAPFVETEWGSEAYEIMKRIKKAVDPNGLLNPGVIINEDRHAHIKNLKALPTVEEEVDRCIECGYCEHKCPSRNITTTPRRRIIVRRALKELQLAGDRSNYDLLLNQYEYDGIDTCAVDGLCATACPVDINTGDLIKRLRNENHSKFQNRVAVLVAKNFSLMEALARTALRTGFAFNRIFGPKAMIRLTTGLRKISRNIPLWSNQLSSPPKRAAYRTSLADGAQVIYMPSCISRMMGTYEGQSRNIAETILNIGQKAGITIAIPDNISGQCCSQIFSSKGFTAAYGYTANRIVDYLWHASREGRIPIMIDVSSCAYTLHNLGPLLNQENYKKFQALKIMDIVDFLHDMVLPVAKVKRKKNHVAIHPVCSLEKMKTEMKFISVARFFAEEVTLPKSAGCCGMAGDRGFLFPELTASAAKPEAKEIIEKTFDGCYSSTKTCEMAMSEATNKRYESIVYLVEECI